MKKCVICGKEFKPKYKQKTCSPKCSEENRRKRTANFAKKYYYDHRQQCLEQMHDYYVANKKKISKYKSEWYQHRKAEQNENN